uniref:Uncharacterized protein n=1 Tax=Cacopsylla melanoneura TaxID=428564 RepID=A0A8D8TN91_9HEMI
MPTLLGHLTCVHSLLKFEITAATDMITNTNTVDEIYVVKSTFPTLCIGIDYGYLDIIQTALIARWNSCELCENPPGFSKALKLVEMIHQVVWLATPQSSHEFD